MSMKFRKTLGWAGVIALLAFPLYPMDAAVDMFFKMGNLKGESTDKSHPGEMDVLAWSWGSSNSGSTHLGGGAGAGKANVQDIQLTKYLDSASPAMLLATMKGTHYDSATLAVRSLTSKGTPYYPLKIDLKDILVTSISSGASNGEDRLTETVTLNFARFKLSYTQVLSSGAAGTPVVTEWNIAENVAGF